MGFQDVTFLPYWASFSTTFLEYFGIDECLRTTTSFRSVVGGKQGHTSCKTLSLQQCLSLCQLNFMGIVRL